MARVETEFTADTRKLERGLAQLDARMDKFAQKAASSMQSVQKNVSGIDKNVTALAASLKASAGLVAAAFSAKEIIAIGDAWSDLTSRVKLAIAEHESAADVMDRLANIANRTYTDINTTAEGYLGASNTLKALGYNTNQTLDYVESLNNAMVVSGAKAERAARVQDAFAKAMASGKLSGNELNTVIETGGRAAELIAKELGVTTLQLRQMGKEGKITGDIIYNAMTKNLETLRNEADSMATTVGDSFIILRNNMMKYIGQADQSLGATEKMAGVIKLLADNLDMVANVALVGVAVAAARAGSSMLVYTGETIGATIATARMVPAQVSLIAAISGTSRSALLASTAMKGLNASMAFFGGPIGIAILAVGAAIYGLSKLVTGATKTSKELDATTQSVTKAYDGYSRALAIAKTASGAARKAALELVEAKRQEYIQTIRNAEANIKEAKTAIEAARAKIAASQALAKAERRTRSVGGFEPGARGAGGGIGTAVQQVEMQAKNEAEQVTASLNALTEELNRITLELNGPAKTPNVATTATGGGDPKSKNTASGPTDADRLRNDADLERETARQIAELNARLLDTAQSRHDLAVQKLGWDRDDAIRAVEKQETDKQINAAAATAAKAQIRIAYDKGVELENIARAREIEESRIDAMRDEAQHADQMARMFDTIARNRADVADTLVDRNRIEREAFDAYQAAELAAMDARHEEARARERLAGAINIEAERRRKAESEAFGTLQSGERAVFDERQRQTNPFAKYVDAAKDTQTNVLKALADGLGTFEDGLIRTIMETHKLGDVFRNVSKQIIADLIRIQIQKSITAPLANMLGMGSGVPFLPKRAASGTRFSPGGLTLVGEAGVELINMPRGSEIFPNGQTKKMLAGQVQSRSAPTFNFSTTVNATGALMVKEIEDKIANGNIAAVAAARQIVGQDMQENARRGMRR